MRDPNSGKLFRKAENRIFYRVLSWVFLYGSNLPSKLKGFNLIDFEYLVTEYV